MMLKTLVGKGTDCSLSKLLPSDTTQFCLALQQATDVDSCLFCVVHKTHLICFFKSSVVLTHVYCSYCLSCQSSLSDK